MAGMTHTRPPSGTREVRLISAVSLIARLPSGTREINRFPRWHVALLLSAALLSGCIDPQVGVRRTAGASSVNRSSAVNSGEHRVQKGETLYAIAFRYALDFRELASWNAIAEPYTIFPNQRLKLRNPTSLPVLEASAPANTVRPIVEQTQTVSTPTGAVVVAALPNTDTMPSEPLRGAATTPPSQARGEQPELSPRAPQLSPQNAQGLPTGFTDAAPSSSTPPTSSGVPMPDNTLASIEPSVAVPLAVPTQAISPTQATAPASTEITPESPVAAIIAPKPIAARNGWGWPVQGKLLSTFSASDAARQGIDIVGNFGDSVASAKAGEVVYSGRGIIGYGELIVIKHDDATLTAYGHNRKRLVKEGQRVTQGQQIAEVGKDPQGRALLHFELRRNGKPVDPLSVLPAR
jgi:lipoprotein NlpD